MGEWMARDGGWTGGGGREALDPGEDGRSEDSTAEAHAVAALKGSGFSGCKLRVLILGVHVLVRCNLGTWRLDIQALDSSCS